jgi:hypothetical protein
MKRLPWPPWKLWNQDPASSKRRVHLGIDYGTSVSKIVFRDNGAPGGESAILVLRNGSFRIPSRVCVTATELSFGDETKADADCGIYDSLKMRVAVEVSGNPQFYVGPTTTLPDGFHAADLASLTVWFLISEGHRAVAAHLKGRMEGVEMDMSMGVPMEFLHDKQLRTSFLSIAKRAWTFYRNEGLLDAVLLIETARRILEKHRAPLSAIPDEEVQDWIDHRATVSVNSPIDIIRSEDEAALWWLMRSPSVRAGPYAKVDIGAGTTHANLFRIFGPVQNPKRSLVRYGAAAVSVGMDAVDRAIAECRRLDLDMDCLAMRRSEQHIPQTDAKVREALIPVRERIYDAYRKAWREASGKLKGNSLELSCWRYHKVFVTGGGSCLPQLVESIGMHPEEGEPLTVTALEQPVDLARGDGKKIATEELPFLTVAYGLSNMDSFLPNPWVRDTGHRKTGWRHLGEESVVKSGGHARPNQCCSPRNCSLQKKWLCEKARFLKESQRPINARIVRPGPRKRGAFDGSMQHHLGTNLFKVGVYDPTRTVETFSRGKDRHLAPMEVQAVPAPDWARFWQATSDKNRQHWPERSQRRPFSRV